jgi:hypothetical protein
VIGGQLNQKKIRPPTTKLKAARRI